MSEYTTYRGFSKSRYVDQLKLYKKGDPEYKFSSPALDLSDIKSLERCILLKSNAKVSRAEITDFNTTEEVPLNAKLSSIYPNTIITKFGGIGGGRYSWAIPKGQVEHLIYTSKFAPLKAKFNSLATFINKHNEYLNALETSVVLFGNNYTSLVQLEESGILKSSDKGYFVQDVYEAKQKLFFAELLGDENIKYLGREELSNIPDNMIYFLSDYDKENRIAFIDTIKLKYTEDGKIESSEHFSKEYYCPIEDLLSYMQYMSFEAKKSYNNQYSEWDNRLGVATKFVRDKKGSRTNWLRGIYVYQIACGDFYLIMHTLNYDDFHVDENPNNIDYIGQLVPLNPIKQDSPCYEYNIVTGVNYSGLYREVIYWNAFTCKYEGGQFNSSNKNIFSFSGLEQNIFGYGNYRRFLYKDLNAQLNYDIESKKYEIKGSKTVLKNRNVFLTQILLDDKIYYLGAKLIKGDDVLSNYDASIKNFREFYISLLNNTSQANNSWRTYLVTALTEVKRGDIDKVWNVECCCPKIGVALNGYLYDDNFMTSFYDFYRERFIDIDFWKRVLELREYNREYVNKYQKYLTGLGYNLGTYIRNINSINGQKTKGVISTMNNNTNDTYQQITNLLSSLEKDRNDAISENAKLNLKVNDLEGELSQVKKENETLKSELTQEKLENNRNKKIIDNIKKLYTSLKNIESEYNALVASLSADE